MNDWLNELKPGDTVSVCGSYTGKRKLTKEELRKCCDLCFNQPTEDKICMIHGLHPTDISIELVS
jgi:hypothetical protein